MKKKCLDWWEKEEKRCFRGEDNDFAENPYEQVAKLETHKWC